MDEQFRTIPLSDLYESPLNTRKHFDEQALADLTKSVKQKGVLVPLLVRENPWKGRTFEIVAGARRRRAATSAAVAELPVRIVTMTDDEVLEAMVTENRQREDLHPLDEAEGFRALLARPGYDVAAIAAHVGLSESFIYQRLKLAELIKPAKKAFLDGAITAAHALQIARLQVNDQERALNACFEQRWLPSSSKKERVLVTARALESFIEQEIHLDLRAAPFAKDDADLIGEAGPCITCPKRTGFMPALFPDVKKKDTCTDGACFHAKIDAHLARTKAAFAEKGEQIVELSSEYQAYNPAEKKEGRGVLYRKDYEEAAAKGSKSCGHARHGLVTRGPRDIGKLMLVCTEKSCKVHAGRYSHSSHHESPAATSRRKAAERKERVANETNRRVLLAVRDKLTGKLDAAVLQSIALVMFNRLAHEVKKSLAALYGWEKTDRKHGGTDFEATGRRAIGKMSALDLTRLLVVTTFLGDWKLFSPDSLKRLNDAARRLKVDVRAIEREVAAKMKPKEKAKISAAEKKAKDKEKGRKSAPSAIPAGEHRCEICGCVESRACPGGCAWDPKFIAKGRYICTTPACLKAAKKGGAKKENGKGAPNRDKAKKTKSAVPRSRTSARSAGAEASA